MWRPAKFTQTGLGHGHKIGSAEKNGSMFKARARREQPQNRMRKRALAAPGFAEYPDGFAVAANEVETLDGPNPRSIGKTVAHRQSLDLNKKTRFAPHPRTPCLSLTRRAPVRN